MPQELIRFVPDIISEIEDIQVIFDIQGSKLTELELSIKDIRDQFFIETATWGLVFWERRYGISYDSTLNYEERRQHIYSKRRARGTITKTKLKSICYPYADEVDIVEHSEDDYFEINLKSYNGFKKSIVNLEEIIEDIKPAHLEVKYALTSIKEYKITHYFASTLVNTKKYTLTNDINASYLNEGNNNVASNLIKASKYELS